MQPISDDIKVIAKCERALRVDILESSKNLIKESLNFRGTGIYVVHVVLVKKITMHASS